MIAFIIWALMGIAFICTGIYDMHSKKAKPFGFWANAETAPMTDNQKYNRALGKLFCSFGVIFILLGLPLLSGQNSPLILISIVGTLFESIAAMAVYTIVIEKKYRK